MSERSRSRAWLLLPAVVTAAGLVGVVIVGTGPNNLALDCRITLVDGGVPDGRYQCEALALPPPAQCAGLLCTGGEPPGCDQDAGLTNAQVRTARAFTAMMTNGAIDTWHAEPIVVDAGVRCFAEVRAHAIVTHEGGAIRYDGNAPALHDVIDAQGAGSIFVAGNVSSRPPWALRGGCRTHVFAGEDPCGASRGFDAGPDPSDAGP
jgi:hypothetical protein